MTTMLERVAAAIAGADSADGPAYAVLARAAIEAMREPTTAMIEAVKNDEALLLYRLGPATCWQVMIDVALSE